MAFRKKMSRGKAKANFRRGAKTHPRNFRKSMRGGIRM